MILMHLNSSSGSIPVPTFSVPHLYCSYRCFLLSYLTIKRGLCPIILKERNVEYTVALLAQYQTGMYRQKIKIICYAQFGIHWYQLKDVYWLNLTFFSALVLHELIG